MPLRPKRPCRHPGCAATHRGTGFCSAHARDAGAYDRNRPSHSKRGYTRLWYAARDYFLAEHPLCVECLRKGDTTAATEVDHVRPHHGDQYLFWDRGNWQPLCKSHHSAKTIRETFGGAQDVRKMVST